MHRFFLDPPPSASPQSVAPLVVGATVDLSPLARQLSRVLRLQPGATIHLLDNSGALFVTEIRDLTPPRALGLIHARQEPDTEPPAPITLYQCSLKADKFEWVLQKGTELGVTRFVPVISARSIVGRAGALPKKTDRWRAVIREAAEQSGRARLPDLAAPLDLADLVTPQADHAGVHLVPWEDAATSAPMLRAALAAESSRRGVALLIGPEGGLEAAEIQALQCGPWQAVSLGPRILRAETAALAAVTIIADCLAAPQ